jgi:hypothetical protein
MEYSTNLEESNPRYRIKRGFGARFEPVHSRILPLTNSFSLALRFRDYLAQR